MIDKSVQNLVIRILDQHYNKTDLESSMRKIVQGFVKEHKKLCEEEQVHKYHIALADSKSFIKKDLATLISIPFSSENLLKAFRAYLPQDVCRVLDEIVWSNMLSHQYIEDRLGIVIYTKTEKYHNERYTSVTFQLKPEFKFFKYRGGGYSYNSKPNFTLYLPTDLCAILARLYEKPESAEFNPIEKIEKTDHVYKGETDILLELPRVIAYAGQKQIKTTTKGKVQTSTLSKMQRKLNLREFYPDDGQKDVKYLRTSLLAALISTVTKPTITEQTVRQLGLLIQSNFRNHFNSVQGILTYLNGTGYVDSYYVKNPEPTLFGLFKSLPTGEWISIKNIESYLKYNVIDVQPIHEGGAQNKLYYKLLEKSKDYSYIEKLYIDRAAYHRSLLLPFIKGTCFLFASYGLLDIAYDTPDTSELGTTAQSHYDGLKYVRLNQLGAFVTAKTSSYEVPTSVSNSSITLSEDSLTIIIDENDTTAPVILEPYTKRVSPNRFKTDYTFFLKSAKNKRDLEDKITLFKQSVKVDMPPNWEDFFKELRQKIDPLTAVKNVYVFQIPTDNQEILRLIAKDLTLRKLCLKAEGYHIIVTKANLPRFRKRLGEFGYLLM